MDVQEIKLTMEDSYFPVIRFGSGKKNLIVIAGVSLTGLEGQGQAIANAYQTLAQAYTVYVLERKKDLPAGYTIEAMAQDVYRAMQRLGMEAAFVYGVSQGGMIGQMLAIKHPEVVEKLVLCSTMCRPTETAKQVASAWLQAAQKHDVVSLNRSFFQVVYSPAFLERIKELLPALEQVGTAKDCDRFCILVEALLDFDVSESLGQMRCPVLVLGDTNDKTIGPEGSYELVQALKCRSYLYDRYSHAVYDEAPDIQERIYDFLKS